MIEFKFPDVGEGIEEGTLVSWKIKEGDSIKEDQAMCEVETDKAVVELPSPATGKVVKLHFKEGDTVRVGQVAVTIDDGQGAPAESKEEPKEKKDMGTVIGTIPEAEEKEGVKEKPEPSEEQTAETEAQPKANPFHLNDGSIIHSVKELKQKIQSLNDEVFYHHVTQDRNDFANWIGDAIGNKELAEKLQSAKTKDEFVSILSPKNLAMPGVRKTAKDKGVDLGEVKGTGSQGQVTKEDLRDSKTKETEGTSQKPAEAQPVSDGKEKESTSTTTKGIKVTKREYDLFGYTETHPFKGIRKAIADHMTKAWQRAAMVTHMDEIDVTELAHLRQELKPEYQKKGAKLTFLPFIVQAAIEALKKHPSMNANVDDENNQIIYKKYYNIGIAVDTPDGLLVPNIKIAQDKNLEQIAKEIFALALKAKNRKLNLAELRGGTFTITNIGSIGGLFATPILNYPETSILLLGRIYEKPMVIDGVIKPRKVLPISVTFDHRVLDGAEAARFTNDLKEVLENPSWFSK